MRQSVFMMMAVWYVYPMLSYRYTPLRSASPSPPRHDTLPVKIPRIRTTLAPTTRLLRLLRLIRLIRLLLRRRRRRLLPPPRPLLSGINTPGTLQTLRPLPRRQTIAIAPLLLELLLLLLLLRRHRHRRPLLRLRRVSFIRRTRRPLLLLLCKSRILQRRRIRVTIIHRTFIPARREFLRIAAVERVDAVRSHLILELRGILPCVGITESRARAGGDGGLRAGFAADLVVGVLVRGLLLLVWGQAARDEVEGCGAVGRLDCRRAWLLGVGAAVAWLLLLWLLLGWGFRRGGGVEALDVGLRGKVLLALLCVGLLSTLR